MKITYITLAPTPNRRAEFWSESDEGPVLVFSYRDSNATVNILAETWLQQPNFCVHICSTDESSQDIVP